MLTIPPLDGLEAEDEGPAEAAGELAWGAADTAALRVVEAVDDVGLVTLAETGADLAVADRGSNLGALKPVDELAGRGSVLGLLTASEPLLLVVDAAAAGVEATAAGTEAETDAAAAAGTGAAACFGACLRSCCCVLFCANRALAVCFGRPAGEAAAGAKLSMSPSSLSSILI